MRWDGLFSGPVNWHMLGNTCWRYDWIPTFFFFFPSLWCLIYIPENPWLVLTRKRWDFRAHWEQKLKWKCSQTTSYTSSPKLDAITQAAKSSRCQLTSCTSWRSASWGLPAGIPWVRCRFCIPWNPPASSSRLLEADPRNAHYSLLNCGTSNHLCRVLYRTAEGIMHLSCTGWRVKNYGTGKSMGLIVRGRWSLVKNSLVFMETFPFSQYPSDWPERQSRCAASLAKRASIPEKSKCFLYGMGRF